MMKLSVLAIFATFSNGFVPRAFMMRKKTHLRVEELDGALLRVVEQEIDDLDDDRRVILVSFWSFFVSRLFIFVSLSVSSPPFLRKPGVQEGVCCWRNQGCGEVHR